MHGVHQALTPPQKNTTILFYVKPGPILAVYYMQLLHAITCSFSKCFQILYIFAQIFKHFVPFSIFLPFFENLQPCPYFLE